MRRKTLETLAAALSASQDPEIQELSRHIRSTWTDLLLKLAPVASDLATTEITDLITKLGKKRLPIVEAEWLRRLRTEFFENRQLSVRQVEVLKDMSQRMAR